MENPNALGTSNQPIPESSFQSAQTLQTTHQELRESNQQAPHDQSMSPGTPYQVTLTDSGSFGWAVLGFFIPIAGLTLFLAWRQIKPKCAKKAGIGTIIGFVLEIIGIASILFSLILATMATSYYYSY